MLGGMTDLFERLKSALDERYAIEREIGSGGMATVYLAEDRRHGRPVAVKVLRPELALAVGQERFLREIRITAGLEHPHILTLIDSGSADGFLYYVMPFIQGETLRDRMDTEGQLPLDDALRISREVADALDFAHEHGVVHRDIKPDNILISGGHAAVMDFGIARAADVSDASGAQRMTETGLVMGTPAYMSPEQVAGDRELDGRSDIYSLACVLFEMLTGRPPFTGPTAQAVMTKRFVEPVPKISKLRDQVPPSVENAILKAMAPEPAERFSRPAHFAAALNTADVTLSAGEPTGRPRVDMRSGAPAGRTPFVGREKERAELLGRLDQLQQGQGSLVLIGGEPGVGKTRLADEILDEAQSRGAACLGGHCYETEGAAPPFGPFLEHLEHMARVLPASTFRDLLGDSAPEIARIMPGLRRMFPDLPEPLEMPADQQRQYLFTKYREFVERGAQRSPIVVLFDDLHWADESTLLLLEHFAQYLSELPVLAIGTYRDVELEVNRPFARTLEQLTRQRHAHRIALRRLPEVEVAALLEKLGGEAPPEKLARAIYHETEGNPFFVEEVFQHLTEEGRLFDGRGRWRDDLDTGELDVPEGVRLVIGRRVERVSDDCRAVLTSAAVIGPRFDLRLLEELGEVEGEALFDALEEAERTRLIAERSVGRSTAYAFVHELIRQTLVEALSLPRRQRKHLHISEAMERAYSDRLEEHASDYSYHLYQAGAAVDENKTIHFLRIAGIQALDGAAFGEALRQFDLALSIEEHPEQGTHAELLRDRGTALRGLGQWEEAAQQWEEALPLFEALQDSKAVARIYLDISLIRAWAGQASEALDVTDRGLAAIGTEANAVRAELLSGRGWTLQVSGEYEEGLKLVDQARRIGEELDDARLVAITEHHRMVGDFTYGRMTQAIERGIPTIATLGDLELHWNRVECVGNTKLVLLYAGRLDELQALGDDAGDQAQKLGHRGAWLLHDLTRLYGSWARTGDLEVLVSVATRDRRLGRSRAVGRFRRARTRVWPHVER